MSKRMMLFIKFTQSPIDKIFENILCPHKTTNSHGILSKQNPINNSKGILLQLC